MKLLHVFVKNNLNFPRIICSDLKLIWISKFKFYSVRTASSQLTSERKKYVNSLLKSEPYSVYYFENGLRKVYPFYYHFSMYCKRRWRDKNIVDMLCSEYALYPREEIVSRISNGSFKVNNMEVDVNYVLKSGDLLTCKSHRHELAVLACPIEILFENDDLLVVNKPPSMPVHPCGLYFYNTVVSILCNEYKRHGLHILHRLDRLTSGILMFAKSSAKSKEIHKEMDLRDINKEYICRVEGDFPDGIITCNKPLKHIYSKIGVAFIHPRGKVSVTQFKKLSYNGKSSVVFCKPLTGRTHQIRAHLQYLGHPIINDPIYNSFIFGPHKGKNGIVDKKISEIMDNLLKEHSTAWSTDTFPLNIKSSEYFLQFSIFKEYYRTFNHILSSEKNCSRILKDENCYFCKAATQDPVQTTLGMFLHALKYESHNWKFVTDMPFWASENWNVA